MIWALKGARAKKNLSTHWQHLYKKETTRYNGEISTPSTPDSFSDMSKSQPLVSGPKNKHAERLIKRIDSIVNELSSLYEIGIELELMHHDDNMSAQLEGLKGAFCNLAVNST
ncbi:hypothetical protein N7490_010971 [Penicillium lividum]|nr:hypothetical protein N7490_010971 [Penicillium lividum]